MKRRARQATVLPLLLALAACANSPRSHFYTLGGTTLPGTVQPAALHIGVGPVTVPAIVDRPQMVLRTGAHSVMLAEQSRWAEPLEDGIARVIADDLGQLLRDLPVRAYPQDAILDSDYRILVDVQHFDSTLGGAAVVDVLWSIRGPGNVTLKDGRSLVRKPAGAGYEGLAAAHTRALSDVSRDIAAALRKVAHAR